MGITDAQLRDYEFGRWLEYCYISGAGTAWRYEQCRLACLDEWPGLYIQALRGRNAVCPESGLSSENTFMWPSSRGRP